jgi:myo-inositol-1-phosphate synthase
VVVSYLPVGSEMATKWYAEQVLEAGCALRQLRAGVHRVASRTGTSASPQRGLPIIGDDIKSQVGATIVHRILTDLFRKRGVRLDRTYQLNFGGNTDFLNMLERERLVSKKSLQDAGRDQPAGPPDARERRARGPERPRAVAGGPQVLLHPHGRHRLRQRAAAAAR